MIVIVCGGLELTDREKVFSSLDYWLARLPISKIVHGCRPGSELLAGEWAQARGVTVSEAKLTKDDWAKLGGRQDAALNRIMLAFRPERVIAFAGAGDMLDQARRAGVKCIEVA